MSQTDASFSVSKVVALARDASMSTTYKPALLKALVRIVRERPRLEIELRTIGDGFVRLFWTQTVTFRLRQAASLLKEPEVVRSIRETAEHYRIKRLSDLSSAARTRLANDMARILKINVLEAFHRSKPANMPPLFSWNVGSDRIPLSEEAHTFLDIDGYALESVANLWWARYLEKVNVLAPHVIEKVERNGAERGSLRRFLEILKSVDENECFYCGTVLNKQTLIHVDHYIPWSFMLSDPFWDLVLSCKTCNLAKSDVLPSLNFLEQLAAVHARRAMVVPLPGVGAMHLPSSELRRYYDAALSVEWPTGWIPRNEAVAAVDVERPW